MPFACIYVPDFSVEAILRAEPELRSKAVAVVVGKPPLEKIFGGNENARRVGISSGMTKLQAELCDDIVLRDRSELQEAAAHQTLLDCAQSFSPRVEDLASDTLLMDLSGLDKLFGPLPKIAREISRRATEMGVETNVAVASTLESALLAAHGFSGVTVVPQGKEAEILGGLPVEVLFAAEANTEEFLKTFSRCGIRKFRDLAALPDVDLSERLGQEGLNFQKMACGAGTRNLVPSDPPLVFEEVMELEYPIVLLEPLAFVLNRMLEHLCARLQGRALAAQELHLQLTLENGRSEKDATLTHFQRTLRLPVPLLDAKTFLKLLQLDLKSNPPGAPVAKVRLRIKPAKPRPAQDGLFRPASPEPEKLELTLARISAVVGAGRSGSPELLDTHQREAFEMRQFTPSGSTARSNGHLAVRRGRPVPQNQNGEIVTALRILRPPIAVRVSHSKGQPSHVMSRKRGRISGAILWAAGPWRSSGDWWEQDAWVRDEWDIAVQEPEGIGLYRLIHDLLTSEWLLQGRYD
ncbi:MAG: DNA polymerase Y family protein [Terriglobales bacterium]